MSTSKFSIEEVKAKSHKFALAALGSGVVAFEATKKMSADVIDAGKKASGDAKAQFKSTSEKSTALFDELVVRGEKVEADGKAKISEVKLPEFKMPEFKKPEFTMPELKMPEFKKPEFSMPEFKMPEFKKPVFTMPELKVPEAVTEVVAKVKAKVEPIKTKFFPKAA